MVLKNEEERYLLKNETPKEGSFSPNGTLWSLFVDGSSCENGSRVGLIVLAPDGIDIEYALKFNFKDSNNESRYEALPASLSLARALNFGQLLVHSDSKMIVNQVFGVYESKDDIMAST